MRHLGDITKINGAEVPPVNVIIGGSPCQDLSIAGRRAGLAGERSGLFMEQIRVIKEMREADAKNGRMGKNIRPRFMVWENVPGAFSSNKGEDFGAVLQETVRVVCKEAPAIPMPKNGWPTAGCLSGGGLGGQWSVAWRVFDAQFWGTPQRRRRIALVADFGGSTASEILFERESVSGYFTSCGATRESSPADAGSGAQADDRTGGVLAFHMTQNPVNGTVAPCLSSGNPVNGQCMCAVCYPDVAHTLSARHDGSPQPDKGNGMNIIVQAAGFKAGNGTKARGIGWEEEKAPTLASQAGGNSIPSVCCANFLFENHAQDARYKGPLDVCPMLPAQLGTGGNNTPLVCEEHPVICIQGNCIDRADTAGCNGRGWTEDVSYTLNTIDRPAIAFAMQGFGDYKVANSASGVKARDYKDATDLVVECAGVDCRNFTESPDLYPTLQAKPNGGQSLNYSGAVRVVYVVRRLTPLECERLQGFPDYWTDITGWVDSKGKVHATTTDSARYKALGNSIAIPPWFYVLQRLTLACGADNTMASLFDGIGGFPLIWTKLNGEGACVWGSEIDDFPIAVTTAHFSEYSEAG